MVLGQQLAREPLLHGSVRPGYASQTREKRDVALVPVRRAPERD